MIARHPLLRAPGLARVLALLMLLAGIVAMHSAVFAGPGHAAEADHAAHGPTEPARTGHLASAVAAEPAPTATHSRATGTHTATRHDAAPVLAAASPAAATTPLAPDQRDTGCGAAGCDEHSAVHSCVFVLVALVLAATLVLLYRLTDVEAAAGRAVRTWRGRRERPPPWTVLTLAQLAILRI
ncbi:hypothetical protein [Nocardia asteroides]|uniref:hypothetical protein n=1 Tax=Nocardia asteroides TaxID=1824 RepID=UPI00340B3405